MNAPPSPLVAEEDPEATLKDGLLELVFKTTKPEPEVSLTKKLKVKSE